MRIASGLALAASSRPASKSLWCAFLTVSKSERTVTLGRSFARQRFSQLLRVGSRRKSEPVPLKSRRLGHMEWL